MNAAASVGCKSKLSGFSSQRNAHNARNVINVRNVTE